MFENRDTKPFHFGTNFPLDFGLWFLPTFSRFHYEYTNIRHSIFQFSRCVGTWMRPLEGPDLTLKPAAGCCFMWVKYFLKRGNRAQIFSCQLSVKIGVHFPGKILITLTLILKMACVTR